MERILGKLSQPLGTLTVLLLAAGATLLTLPFLQLLFARSGAPSEGKKHHGGHLALYLFDASASCRGPLRSSPRPRLRRPFSRSRSSVLSRTDPPVPLSPERISGNYYALINGAAMFFQFIVCLFLPLLVSDG